MQIKRRTFVKGVKVALFLYALFGIIIYYTQDYFFFQATPLKKEQRYNFPMPYREVNLAYTRTQNLNIIEFEAGATPRGVVLYFHGNRKNISWYARFAPMFTQHGYEVWMLDYPGYGKSTGHITEELLYDYASQLYKLAAKKFAADSIVIFGKSMGTGIAAELASGVPCKMLILETPYYSLSSVAAHFFPIYPMERMTRVNIPTHAFIPLVHAPVHIFHGTDDGIIPYSNALQLKPLLKPGDQFVSISGGHHNNLRDFPQFTQAIDSLLNQ